MRLDTDPVYILRLGKYALENIAKRLEIAQSTC